MEMWVREWFDESLNGKREWKACELTMRAMNEDAEPPRNMNKTKWIYANFTAIPKNRGGNSKIRMFEINRFLSKECTTHNISYDKKRGSSESWL
jgi:hypothetical protein